MRYNFTFAAVVSVLLAVAATVQGAPGKWLYLGVAVVTVALENLTRRTTTISSSPGEIHEPQPTPPTDADSLKAAQPNYSFDRSYPSELGS
jgi:hypothetical protein